MGSNPTAVTLRCARHASMQMMRAVAGCCFRFSSYVFTLRARLCWSVVDLGLGRGESGWCPDGTSTPGAWRHAGVQFLLSGAMGRFVAQRPHLVLACPSGRRLVGARSFERIPGKGFCASRIREYTISGTSSREAGTRGGNRTHISSCVLSRAKDKFGWRRLVH